MHEHQLTIDVDRVRELVDAQFPAWRGLDVERVASDGTVNAIFRIGPGLAARFPLLRTDRADLEAEAAAMTSFAEHCPFPAPAFVAMGRPAPDYPSSWSVQTWLPGEVATPTGLAASAVFARDLAALITSLRKADTAGRRFDGKGRGGHLPDHDAWMQLCFEKSEDLLDVPRLRALWARLRELPSAGPDVMSHKDLTPPNLLVSGERLVGVLDAGGFGAADPALDLVAAWHLLDGEARQAMREALGEAELPWKRGAAWAFQQAMGMVWYYQRSNQGMSHLGRTTLSRILDDPDI